MRCSLLPYQFRVWPRGARVSLINQAFKDSSVGELGRGRQRAGAPAFLTRVWPVAANVQEKISQY